MINMNGYNEVSVGGKSLPAGGYIAKIVNVYVGIFQDGTEALFVCVDIIEGEFTGYFAKDFDRLKKFAPKARWSDAGTMKLALQEDGKVHWRLKKFLETVKDDNPDLTVIPDAPFDERDLIGKSCGIIVGHKEGAKTKKDGSRWANPYVSYAVHIDDIRNGDFTVPDVKKYQGSSTPAPVARDHDDFGGEPTDPDDTPF